MPHRLKPGEKLPPNWNSEVYCAGVEERISALERQRESKTSGWWALAAAGLGGVVAWLLEHFVFHH